MSVSPELIKFVDAVMAMPVPRYQSPLGDALRAMRRPPKARGFLRRIRRIATAEGTAKVINIADARRKRDA